MKKHKAFNAYSIANSSRFWKHFLMGFGDRKEEQKLDLFSINDKVLPNVHHNKKEIMKRKQKAPQNGVELMAQVFMSICETAPKLSVMDAELGQGIAVKLKSGSNEGQAVLFYRNRSLVIIEFHSYIESALHPDHTASKWLGLNLELCKTQVTDPLSGEMYSQHFFMSNPDFGMLIPARRKLMPFVITFLELISTLPCCHIWNKEYEAAWGKVMETDFSLKATAIPVVQ